MHLIIPICLVKNYRTYPCLPEYWRGPVLISVLLFFFFLSFTFLLLLRNGHCRRPRQRMQPATYHGPPGPNKAPLRGRKAQPGRPTWTTTVRQLLDQVSPSLSAMNDCFIGLLIHGASSLCCPGWYTSLLFFSFLVFTVFYFIAQHTKFLTIKLRNNF